MLHNILYTFISHSAVVQQDYRIISSMMDNFKLNNFLIFYGNNNSNKIDDIDSGSDMPIEQNDHLICLDCDDSYCGLPEKMHHVYKYLSNKQFEYIVKLDRTVIIKKPLESLESDIMYAGHILTFQSTTFHYNRCDKDSKWHNKPFNGKIIKYCMGGTYILSNRCVQIMSNDNCYDRHIYEDYYTGYTLKKNSVFAQTFPLSTYFFDSNHPQFYP